MMQELLVLVILIIAGVYMLFSVCRIVLESVLFEAQRNHDKQRLFVDGIKNDKVEYRDKKN